MPLKNQYGGQSKDKFIYEKSMNKIEKKNLEKISSLEEFVFIILSIDEQIL